MRAFVTALCFMTAALAFGPAARAQEPAPDPAEREAILKVVDAFFVALAARDGEAWRELFLDKGVGGTSLYVREGPEGWTKQRGSLAQSAASLPRGTTAIEEYYWDATVLIRPTFAIVWAPYEFISDGARTHCGIDLFTFARLDPAADWKIADVAYTVEPDACAELKPDGVEVRPRR